MDLKALKESIKENKKVVITSNDIQFELEIPSLTDVLPLNIKDEDAEQNLVLAKKLILKKLLSHTVKVCDVDVDSDDTSNIPFDKSQDAYDLVEFYFDENPHVLNDVVNQLFKKFEERITKLNERKKK